MAVNHIIEAGYTAKGFFRTRPAFQYDYGQILKLEGFTLPQAFEVHFGTGNDGSVTMIGHDNQVDVPDECLRNAATVTAWLFLHDTANDGETRFVIEIPVKKRAEITNQEPTPVQQDTITQAIAALNAGVEAAQDAQHAAENAAETAAEDARQAADDALNGKADKTDTVLLTTLSRGRKADTTVGNNSIAFGYNVEASGLNSAAFGANSKATQIDAFASGSSNTASGRYSSASGNHNTASGQGSSVCGEYNEASGQASSAEGSYNAASGSDSHSEGLGTIASGRDSHSEGRGTIANHRSQHASGQYNIADDSNASGNERGNYVEIVGNGTADNARSNARTLDWDGNEKLSGDLTVNAGTENEVSVTGLAEETNKKYEKPASGIPASDLAPDALPDISGKADKTDTVLETTLSRGRKANTTVGIGSMAFGNQNTASGGYSVATGNQTTASGSGSHAEGTNTNAAESNAHAEGNGSIASGAGSHAEGNGILVGTSMQYTTATRSGSHAEGLGSLASANGSHSEGQRTTASGNNAHAEGSKTIASGSQSHAEGMVTEANHRSQHVGGEYNIPDDSASSSSNRGNYVEIIGNGTADNARSNARTLDWSGNEELAGDLTINKGSTNESSMSDVAEDVNSLKSALDDIETDIDDIYDGKPTEIVHTANKLNPAEVETGKNLDANGTTKDNSDHTITGFIPLDTTKSSVVFSGMNLAGTQRVGLPTGRICFYNETKAFLSRVDSVSSNTVTAIPTNAAYVRFDGTNVYWERSPMVEFVDSISEISATYVEYEKITGRTHGINYLDEKQQEIDGRLSDAEEELTNLSGLSSQVNSNTSRLDDITGASKYISELATFDHGYINSAGNYVSTYQYRIATPDYINIEADINLVIANGFRVYLAYYDANNAVISVGWVTGALTIETGSKIRMTIARVTEDSSETADIAVFCSKVTYSLKESVSYLAGKVRDIDAQIPYGCTWDWWISANSIDKFGNAYIGYVDTDAYAGVIRRQPDGVMQYKRLEKSWNDDDHNGTATIVLDDGRILVIGSHGHAQNNHIICYRSTEPYSIDSMEKLSFDIPETGNYKYCTTYSQIFKYNGKLFDFMRVSVQQSSSTITDGNGYLCLISDDDGDTWTAYKAIQSSDPYISFAVSSDDAKIIKGVYTNNPGTRPVSMMKGFTFNMSTYEFANLAGTKIGELVLLDGGVIADENVAHYADMTDLVQRGETSRSCRLFYVCKTTKSTTAFLYAIADDSTNADWVYKLYLNGTSIDVGRSGVPFGNNTYISGACFGKDADTIYYVKATTTSADGNHELHKVKVSNGAVVSDEIITESSVCIIRPLFLGNGELATVVGHYNDQTPSGYNGSYTAWELKPLFTHA